MKPVKNEQITSFDIEKLHKLIGQQDSSPSSATDFEKSIIAHSDAMKKIIKLVKKVATVPSTVLLIGESGVGKEMIANQIYQLGHRYGKPFIKVNCGAIPEHLLESELFGYKKGAFTGADPGGKTGLFTQANHGVIFMDEIGELPLNLQVKLLRIIQEKEVTPLGAASPIKIDVQIIAATNQNLEHLVAQGKFREDLYYRLNVVPIHIPPLRERLDDIPFLVRYFLDKYNHRYKRSVNLTAEAIELLKTYPWYGNVRELENTIERMVVTSEDESIDAKNLAHFVSAKEPPQKPDLIVSRIMPLQQAIDYVEEQLIIMAMEKYRSINMAAKALGLTQPTMSRKYQKIKLRLEQREQSSRNSNEKYILEQELDNQLRSVSVVIAALINVDKIKKLVNHLSHENPVYRELQQLLTMIRMQEGKIEWSYIWKLSPEQKIIFLVADEKLDIMPGQEYAAPPEMKKAILDAYSGKIVVTPKYTDVYGQWKSSIAPIRDETGQVIAILGSDFSVEYIDMQIKNLRKLLSNK